MVVYIKKVAMVLVAIVLALSVTAYFSINYIFDKMIGNQILSQIELDITPQDNAIEDNNKENKDSGLEDIEKETGEDFEIGESEQTTNGDKNTNDKSGGSNKNQQFTKEQIKSIQDNFSTRDKLKVMSMLSSKLSSSEIKALTSIASGGVDNSELNKIKGTLKSKLDDNEINYLKNLYEKYN